LLYHKDNRSKLVSAALGTRSSVLIKFCASDVLPLFPNQNEVRYTAYPVAWQEVQLVSQLVCFPSRVLRHSCCMVRIPSSQHFPMGNHSTEKKINSHYSFLTLGYIHAQ